jgi:hypothetical protein
MLPSAMFLNRVFCSWNSSFQIIDAKLAEDASGTEVQVAPLLLNSPICYSDFATNPDCHRIIKYVDLAGASGDEFLWFRPNLKFPSILQANQPGEQKKWQSQ